jgi:uncharacterized membrane protein
MSDSPIQVFVAAYGDEVGASQSLKDFQQMHRDGSIELIDAAVIVRRADGAEAAMVITEEDVEEEAPVS